MRVNREKAAENRERIAGRLATHAEGGGLRCYELASIAGASQQSGEACCRIEPWPAQPVD